MTNSPPGIIRDTIDEAIADANTLELDYICGYNWLGMRIKYFASETKQTVVYWQRPQAEIERREQDLRDRDAWREENAAYCEGIEDALIEF